MSEDQIQTGDVERRFVGLDSARVELREHDEQQGIGGLAIPVEREADIGPFTESISRDAVDHAIEQGWDIRGLFNHDPNMVLARTKSGTMSVTSGGDGMEFDIPEMPESRSDVMEAIDRGDVDGNSFSFTVAKEEWDESESREKPHRTINQFGRLFDLGPVTFPAYEGQTTVSARAMEHVQATDGLGNEGTLTEADTGISNLTMEEFRETVREEVASQLEGDEEGADDMAEEELALRRRRLRAIEAEIEAEA